MVLEVVDNSDSVIYLVSSHRVFSQKNNLGNFRFKKPPVIDPPWMQSRMKFKKK